MLLGAPGIATNGAFLLLVSNKKLLGAKGIATSNKCLTTRNKKLVVTSYCPCGASALGSGVPALGSVSIHFRQVSTAWCSVSLASSGAPGERHCNALCDGAYVVNCY